MGRQEVTETQLETPDAPGPEPDAPGPEPAPDEEIPFEDPEPQMPPPDEQPTGEVRSEKELEALRKKLDTSANTWKRRVEELLGDDFGSLVPCELCSFDIPGFHWPAEIQTPISDQHERLLRVLIEPAAPEYREASNVHQCPDCAGWGKVNSGSRIASHTTVTCPACKGYGYVPPPVPGQSNYAQASGVQGAGIGQVATNGAGVTFDTVSGEVVDTGAEEPEPTPDADIWGSPRLLPDGQENPNYGKMPQYKSRELP
jgi:hypothetical protein